MQAAVATPKSGRRYHDIAAQISRYVSENGLPPGSRLPGEISLAKICGVSRPALREALVALEVSGELTVRVGSGAYVREEAHAIPLLLASRPGPLEVLRGRILIESEIAGDAALRASVADIDALEANVQRMRRSLLVKTGWQVFDKEFHVLLARAAGNDAIAGIVTGLWSAMYAASDDAPDESGPCDHHQVEAMEDHEAIFAAVADRNANAARRAMRSHLYRVKELMLTEAPSIIH